MKVKDNGSDNVTLQEKTDESISLKEINSQFEFINKNIKTSVDILGNTEENLKKLKSNQLKRKLNQCNEKNDFFVYKSSKYNINSKNKINHNFIKNNFNKINNCIKYIDFDKNIIILNKLNLNNLYNDIKNEKRKDYESKKGGLINIFVNEKFIFNKDISKKNFEYFLDNNFYSSFEDFGQIKSNSLFPTELIEKFLDKKRNKSKEKNEFNYCSLFGNNPLKTLKDIQNNLKEQYPSQKNNKIAIKQYKINQKNLIEQNTLLQNYIKTLPVLNCPESKIFKLNQYYIFNKINEDKNVNIYNQVYNKKIKNDNYYNNEKDESEEETIDKHKKKFLNKKKNESFDKK